VRDEKVPILHWEDPRGAADCRQVVIFERLNGALCGVGPVRIWRHQLHFDAFRLEKRLDELACLVVHAVILQGCPSGAIDAVVDVR
jgi:hypothetical protein